MGITYDNQENIIGDLIRKKRAELNMSRKEFAKLADVSLSAIASYELGTSSPNTLNAIKVARALECDIVEFFSYIKQPDSYDDSEMIRCFDMHKGFCINDFPHRMVKTFGLRKNENPDRYFCVYYKDEFLLFMSKKNHFGKEPLVLIVKEDSDEVQFARMIDGKLFEFENTKEIEKAHIIAQFKRCIIVQ